MGVGGGGGGDREGESLTKSGWRVINPPLPQRVGGESFIEPSCVLSS